MSGEDDEKGFSYHVSDEQLFAFSRCSVGERLAWLEEMREFSIAASTPEVRASWRRLRRAEPSLAEPSVAGATLAEPSLAEPSVAEPEPAPALEVELDES